MISVFFHLGDWMTSTVDLTPTERGVYFDLLCRYYEKERPLMQVECTRIARGYAPNEQEAMHYVLETFFTKDGDSYRHARCDEEISKMAATIEKRKKAANARWSRDSAKSDRQKSDSCDDANGMHLDMHEQCTCNANGMQTINHKPQSITTTKEKVEKEKSNRDPLVPFPDSLPDDWKKSALETRTDIDPERVFLKLKARYVGTTMKKALKTWRREFMNWIGREFSSTPPASKSKVAVIDEPYFEPADDAATNGWGF